LGSQSSVGNVTSHDCNFTEAARRIQPRILAGPTSSVEFFDGVSLYTNYQ
jgi:hypothetical protein